MINEKKPEAKKLLSTSVGAEGMLKTAGPEQQQKSQ
jgi:hypothetical protein